MGPALFIIGNGGSLCTLATVAEPAAFVDVPLMAESRQQV